MILHIKAIKLKDEGAYLNLLQNFYTEPSEYYVNSEQITYFEGVKFKEYNHYATKGVKITMSNGTIFLAFLEIESMLHLIIK